MRFCNGRQSAAYVITLEPSSAPRPGCRRSEISQEAKAHAPRLVSSPRLVLSRFEFEGVSSGENALEAGEDEEEVWLFWRDSHKEIRSKSVRELAQDAKEGQKEDRDVLSYYR